EDPPLPPLDARPRRGQGRARRPRGAHRPATEDSPRARDAPRALRRGVEGGTLAESSVRVGLLRVARSALRSDALEPGARALDLLDVGADSDQFGVPAPDLPPQNSSAVFICSAVTKPCSGFLYSGAPATCSGVLESFRRFLSSARAQLQAFIGT